MAKSTLWVQFRQAGFHSWPDGPEYLRTRHRHLFHFRVSVHNAPVDDERTIELHDLLNRSEEVVHSITAAREHGDFGTMSCETIAHVIAQRLSGMLSRPVTVSVSEDGECGATVQVQSY